MVKCRKCGKILPISVIVYMRDTYLERGQMCLCNKKLYFPKKHYPELYETRKRKSKKRG